MSNKQKPNKNQFLADRTIERGTGCWNCKHRDSWEDGKKFWFGSPTSSGKRDQSLSKAVAIATSSPLGEGHPSVVNIRRFVHIADNAMRNHEAIHCTKGITAQGVQVGDITGASYMCEKWTGMDGASVAKIDGRIDKLPEELLFDDQPKTLKQLVENSGSLLTKREI